MAAIKVKIKRENMRTKLTYSVDQEIENLFEEVSEGVRESSSWEDLKYYHMPPEARSDAYRNKLERNNLCDDFGYDVVQGNKFNIAWIRTVGGEGEIEIPNHITLTQVQEWVASASRFLKSFFSEHFKDYEVTGTIEINI